MMIYNLYKRRGIEKKKISNDGGLQLNQVKSWGKKNVDSNVKRTIKWLQWNWEWQTN